MRLVMIASSVLFLLGAVGGCRTVADPYHPKNALAQYVRHVQANDSKAAYSMLSEKLRRAMSYEAFARKWKKNYAELRIQAADIRRQIGMHKQYEVQARMKAGKRRKVVFAHEGNRWRIVAGVGGGVEAPTPRAAVSALIKALETKNLSVFIKLLGADRRKLFLREMTLRLEKLKANLDRDFEITGNRARLQYDPRYWIMLLKENGAWRVVEFN
jgi:hypothetical protein